MALIRHKEHTCRILCVLILYVTCRYMVVTVDIDPLQSVGIMRRYDI